MAAGNFHVIIIGGGPNGITAAHALYHAGINFTVLERRINVFEDTGASLVLSPHNLRVFHQLGILQKLLDIGAPFMHLNQGFNPHTRSFKRTYALSLFKHNHGSPLVAFHRAHLVRALYDFLPQGAKDLYFTGKNAVDISVYGDGVEVICKDGTTYPGTIVIGADGVHSKTRSIMGRLALHTDPSLSHSWDPEMPFTAHYRCLWASFDRETDIGDSYETQGRHRSAVYLTGQVKGWIFLYERLPEPSRDRVKYDKEDIRAFAESFADWTLHDTLKVRDVICQKSFVAGMANLEEGVAKNKSWGGRIVLVGDACHKFTPNAGLGFNNGVQDVVSLCNRLNALNSTNSTDSLLKPSFTVPDAVSLQQAFEEYEAERAEPLKGDYRGAADATRLSAWENWRYYALAKYILRFGFVRNYLITHKASPGIRDGLVLDYITADEPFTGSILWEHPLGNP